MARLILSMDGLVLKEIPLNKERISIGRKPHNDIQIDNLAISGDHAVIVTILDSSFLEDLGSTNGTTVNGQAVTKYVLKNNDVIELGKYRIKYLAETAVSNVFDGVRTSGLSSSAIQAGRFSQTQTTISRPPAADAEQLPLVSVRLYNGPTAGKVLDLVKMATTLGKPGVQVAVVTRRQEGVFLTAIEGANKPTVNGQAIGNVAFALQDGDVIEVAGVRMEVLVRNVF